MASVTVRDETRPGRVVSEFVMSGLSENVTLRELIRTRIREEVAIANLARSQPHRLLVQPSEAEVTANGFVMRARRLIDWEAQAGIAEQAFAENGFFVIVDGRQVDDLDEPVMLSADSVVRFLRLTPLVGG